MNKLYFLPFIFCLIFLSFSFSLAQPPGEWTWMGGTDSTGSIGNYGTMGVPSANNYPPAAYEACEWTDKDGNFWLFGGGGGQGSSVNRYFNDLWKYDPVAGAWTWISGGGFNNADQPSIYGVKGVPSVNNHPGSRCLTVLTWVDTSGNFWMFGGNGMDSRSRWGTLNDLWKYDVANNLWTWMSGSDTCDGPYNYGVRGVTDPSNLPPPRSESAASWVDKDNNLWMFGGSSMVGETDDLWKYNIGTNQWTWVNGSSTAGAPAVYGTKSVPDPSNTPGGRMVWAKWKDIKGNFWIYGGGGVGTFKSDLWKYDPVSNIWTWMSGRSSNSSHWGSNQPECTTSDTIGPGSGSEGRISWTDKCGNFWLFSNSYGRLWYYNVYTGKWTLFSHFSKPNNYGTRNVSSPSNMPAGRAGGLPWVDKAGNLWLYGGMFRNDLWRYVPDTSCPGLPAIPVSSSFTVDTLTACAPFTLKFRNNSQNADNYAWDFGDGQTDNSAEPVHIYPTPGNYVIKLVATSNYPSFCSSLPVSDTLSRSVTVPQAIAVSATVKNVHCTFNNPIGSIKVNVQGGQAPYHYKWNMTTADTNRVDSLVAGTYHLTITDANGCHRSDSFEVRYTPEFLIYDRKDSYCDSLGWIVLFTSPAHQFQWSNGDTARNVYNLRPGTYSVTITDSLGCVRYFTHTINGDLSLNIDATADKETIEWGEKAQLQATLGNQYTYEWIPPGSLSDPHTADPVASPTATTTYYVTGRYKYCEQRDSLVIRVSPAGCVSKVFMPTAFSPNSDGSNDVLYVRGDFIKEMYLVLYNKWGEKVFEATDISQGWDGTYKGSNAPSGVYDYYLKCRCVDDAEYVKKGNVTLIR